jgi:hypothetical protein
LLGIALALLILFPLSLILLPFLSLVTVLFLTSHSPSFLLPLLVIPLS